MRIRQWEILKARPAGFQTDHWFVVVTSQELCDNPRVLNVNGLACFTLRGEVSPLAVVLNGADGFPALTTVPCHYFHGIPKSALHSSLGLVSWERQQQIKAKIKEIFRF